MDRELAAVCGNGARARRRGAVWTRGGRSRAEWRRGPGTSELRAHGTAVVFIWRDLGVSYIIGLAAVTKNKTQNESGLNNTETHFSLPRRSRVAVQRAGPLQGHQRPRSIAPRFSASPARAIPRCRRAAPAPAPAITSASQKVGRKRGSVTWKRGVPLPLALQRPHLPRGDIQL